MEYININDGLEIELQNGRIVRSTQFGVSRLGLKVTGRPSYRKVREMLAARWREATQRKFRSQQWETNSSGIYRVMVRIPLLPPGIFLFVYGIASVSYGLIVGV